MVDDDDEVAPEALMIWGGGAAIFPRAGRVTRMKLPRGRMVTGV